MFLSDIDIKKAIEADEIRITDFSESRLQQASYDIRLGNKFLVTEDHNTPIIDPINKILPKYKEVVLQKGETFTLHPGTTVLGTSLETFGSEKYLIQLSGKSSLARLGLIVHNTAGLINPGHYLNITFELANMNHIPIILHPDMEIAQLLFSTLSSLPSKSYAQTGRYADGEANLVGYTDKV
ncbi:dCTP deaminase [Candidatus Gracilibacteria bacterium]|nr:dCTP deaminase [Candidatus Gracilibacteria bacterium]